jgi:phage-related holin
MKIIDTMDYQKMYASVLLLLVLIEYVTGIMRHGYTSYGKKKMLISLKKKEISDIPARDTNKIISIS